MRRRTVVALAWCFAIAAGLAPPAHGAASDCPPLNPPASYAAPAAAELRDFDSIEMRANGLSENGYVTIAGRVCKISYTPKDGTAPLSDPQIQADFRGQLGKLGAQIVYSADDQTTAKLPNGGKELWVVIYSQQTEINLTVVEKQAPKQILTTPSGNDYRLLGHMPNYRARPAQIDENAKAEVHVEDADYSHDIPVAGKRITIAYLLADGASANSDIEIQTNYRNRLKELGAQFLSISDNARTSARLEENGRNLWLNVYSQPGEIDVIVIEEKPVTAAIEPPRPDTLKTALARDGHVALYINFDFAKATLKPDAQAVVAQVVALLKDDPQLRLAIEGHTDNVGGRSYNQNLSTLRAAAVVEALTRAGVDAARLSSTGFGSDKPLTDNSTAEARAKNRRVELVKR